MEEILHFTSDHLTLEGLISEGADKGAVLCHPHPMYGGSMDNNVVLAAAAAFQKLGWTTLRFNFRGVGSSEGTPGDGEREVRDVQAALRCLRVTRGMVAERIMLVGYSFGAWVGLRALLGREALLGWVAIALPVGIWDLSFAVQIGGNKLIIAGDRDPFCPLHDLNRFLETLPDPKDHVILPGVDHFFWGQEGSLSRVLEERLEDLERIEKVSRIL